MRLFPSIRLDKSLDARLGRLSRLTGRSKSYYVNQALQEQIQRLESGCFARRAARQPTDSRECIVPLYELERALGLDD